MRGWERLWRWCAWVVGRPISITYEYTPFPPLWQLKSTRPAVLGIPAQGTKFSKSMLATAAKNIVAKILVGSGGFGSNSRELWRSKLVFQNPQRLWGVGLQFSGALAQQTGFAKSSIWLGGGAPILDLSLYLSIAL